jgi:hypothetical protein
MMAPNLKDLRPRAHWEYCWGRACEFDYGPPRPRLRLGDLRRCEHGRIQVVEGGGGRIAGPGTWRWRDLPRLFNWRQYNRARDLLDNATSPAYPEPTTTKED